MRSIFLFTAVVVAAIGVGVGALAASGGAALPRASAVTGHTGAGASATPPLSGFCRRSNSVEGGSISRTVAFGQDHLSFSFGTPAEFSSPAAALEAARLFCSLPAAPAGLYSCPVDLGVTYSVTFDTAAGQLRGSFDPGGCDRTSGVFGNRVVDSAAFWLRLGDAIGLKDATRATFSGHLP